MVALLESEPRFEVAAPPVKRCNLLLHCGAHQVERPDVEKVDTPEPSSTWYPLAHDEVLRQTEAQIKAAGLTILSEAHALSHGGNRYFGLMEVGFEGKIHDEWGWVVGIRNSHDKRFPAGLVAGSQVLVCDNLSFNGEIGFGRKHTRFIRRDLPWMITESVETLLVNWKRLESRFEDYRCEFITEMEVHDLMVRAVDAEVIPVTMLPKVLEEWRNPSYEAFMGRSLWSLFNAFTHTLKGSNLNQLPRRTTALHGLLDHAIGLN